MLVSCSVFCDKRKMVFKHIQSSVGVEGEVHYER